MKMIEEQFTCMIFFMYGMYSKQYNRFTVAYLLVMEAVLKPRHKWTLLDGNTYYCHIEAYHIYMEMYLEAKYLDANFHGSRN